MTPVVLDTDVASAVLKERVPTGLGRQLIGRPLAITFVTVGELTKRTLVRHWGPQRAAGLHRFFASVVVLPYSPTVATLWGELQAHAQLRGRPRPINDTWIAVCCLAREFALATLNRYPGPGSPPPGPARSGSGLAVVIAGSAAAGPGGDPGTERGAVQSPLRASRSLIAAGDLLRALGAPVRIAIGCSSRSPLGACMIWWRRWRSASR